MKIDQKSCGEIARELYGSQGKDFCVGLMLHLIMYISGGFDGIKEGSD